MEGIAMNIATSIPICTRIWTGSILFASFLDSTDVVHGSDLVFVTSFHNKKEYWRLVTSFIYFGPFNINLLNWLIHISQHSSAVELSFFKSRDYLWFMFLNLVFILLYSNYIQTSYYLGPELVVSTTYNWCRKNPDMDMSLFFGLINFKAHNYPYSIIIFSFIRHGLSKRLLTEFSGLFAGHIMFYFENVFEKLFGLNPLAPPWKYFDREASNFPHDEVVNAGDETDHDVNDNDNNANANANANANDDE